MNVSDIPRDVIDIVRSPVSLSPLRDTGGLLVDMHGTSFPVILGIPVLIADPHERTEAVAGFSTTVSPADSSSEPPLDGMVAAVIRSYRERSTSYFDDNYQPGRNPPRENRQDLVQSLMAAYFTGHGRILEAGAGPAVLGREILKLTDFYVAVDLSLENLLEGRSRLDGCSCVCANLTALPFADNTFDGVTAVGCLEYVRPLERALSELFRVAKPHTTLILTFANRGSPGRWWDEGIVNPVVRLRNRSRGRPTYRRELSSAKGVRQFIEASGGMVEEILFFNQGLLGYPLSRYGGTALWRLGTERFPRLKQASSEFAVVARAATR